MRWSAGTRQSRKTISAWLPRRPNSGSGCAIVPMSRTISMPGVPAGTMKIDACLCGRPSGLVSANTRTMSATDALVMNHLWPSITHSSPSSAAVVPMTVGSAPARNGSVSAKALEISPRRLGQSHRSFCASVAPWASSSMFPLSGACTPKIVIDIMQRPMISDISASFSWPKPGPPSFGSRKAPHRPCAFTCVLQVALDDRPTRRRGSSSRIGSSGMSSLVDERAHPGELRLELRLGLEVPRHGVPPLPLDHIVI